jgi:hypothetical protein
MNGRSQIKQIILRTATFSRLFFEEKREKQEKNRRRDNLAESGNVILRLGSRIRCYR